MAYSNGPSIVTDGLVLYLDAANPRSYVSGSSVWNDLSGNNNHFQIYPGVQYSSGSGGELLTANNAGMTSSIAPTNTTTGTVHLWLRTTDTDAVYVVNTPLISRYIGAYASSGGYYSNNSGVPSTKVNAVASGLSAPTLNNRYFLWECTNVDFSGWSSMGFFTYGGGLGLIGHVAMIAVYNRNLTQKESEQNFNAQRSRFGV